MKSPQSQGDVSPMAEAPVPKHVAIIMDGNGRWAERRGQDRPFGHREGVKALKPIVKEARQMGIEVLTVYAFSTENWVRPSAEVDVLMSLLVEFLALETPELKAEGVKICTIGDVSKLPEKAQNSLRWAKEETVEETGMILNLALNYGARDEMLRAVTRWRAECPEQTQLSADDFATFLDTAGLPDPDLLIRTSGEYRLSNFLLWQLAYAEIYISDVLWPDFGPRDLKRAVEEYHSRHRRFGGLG